MMKTRNFLELLDQYKVVIPPIQRDFAQGRNTGKIPHIRERFIEAISHALSSESIHALELDFVYGYVEYDRSSSTDITLFKPLDGQQRLTTLFLLHWYAAQREGMIDQVGKVLSNFSYETRKSSRDFCQKLIGFKGRENGKSIVDQIENEPWFFSAWRHDPTISSMLVVLETIEKRLGNVENLWPKLEGKSIVFNLLEMEELGLPDDLYIKMNARGKPLTDFEYFKSQFSTILSADDSKVFNEKIDKGWSDLFWNVFKGDESRDVAKDVDNGFLSFFWFVTDIVIIKTKVAGGRSFWLDIVKEVYQTPENVKFLFDCLSLFEKLERDEPDYFDSLFYIESADFSVLKTRLFFNNPRTNLFRKCVETYKFGDRNSSFSVGEQLLLYAFILTKFQNHGARNGAVFRLLRNVFAASEDQLRNEYLGFLYADVEMMISSNQYSENSKLSKRQLEQEMRKSDLIAANLHLREMVFRLEDHHLLRGDLSAFEIDVTIPGYSVQFHKVFHDLSDYFQISQAMLTIGNYTQDYGKLRRFGNQNSSTWREILTPSESRADFDQTKKILSVYLDLLMLDSTQTDNSIISQYLAAFEAEQLMPKTFLYYYVKYSAFKFWKGHPTSGFYSWEEFTKRPYEAWMLFKRQFNGRHWSPFLLQISILDPRCSADDYGKPMQFTQGDLILMIQNQNRGFEVRAVADDEHAESVIQQLIESSVLDDECILPVKQNDEGIDLEDRILKCLEFLRAF